MLDVEYKHMVERKDYSSWKVATDLLGSSSGMAIKVWLVENDYKRDKAALFKHTKDTYTTDDVSEKLSHDIAKLIDIKCANVELGYLAKKISEEAKSNKGCLSFNFLEKDESLTEGITFISSKYPTYNSKKFQDHEGNKYTLDMILKSIEGYIPNSDILNMCAFDFLTGNSDRHHSNWGLISKNNKDYKFSPLYDNSSSLCAYMTKDEVKACLGKDKMRFDALVDSKSRTLIKIDNSNCKNKTHKDLMKYIFSKYPSEANIITNKIVTNVHEDSIGSILNNYTNVLSEDKRKLILKFILAKIDILKEIQLENSDDKAK